MLLLLMWEQTVQQVGGCSKVWVRHQQRIHTKMCFGLMNKEKRKKLQLIAQAHMYEKLAAIWITN